jgi:RimJ/RimL family protein N-acetyltransferase
MNSPYPHIIAKDGDTVVGYTLVMQRDLRDEIPVLIPMFDEIDKLTYNGRLLKDTAYVVMGQVCIAREYRGKGIFEGLYAEMARRMKSDFDVIITEVSSRNTRSLRAHDKIGFEKIHEYRDKDGEDWVIVLWNFR